MKKSVFLLLLSLFTIQCSLFTVHCQTWKEMLDSIKFYQEKQDLQTALNWAQKALPEAKEQFSELDTNYISVLGSIGELFYYSGKLDSAVFYQETHMELSRRLFKGDHPYLACSINNMASFYDASGRYSEAEPLYKETLEMYRRLFKGGHPDLAGAINNMASFYDGSGRYAEAEPLFKEALEMYRRLFKGDHPNLAASINNMASFYGYRGRHAEAESLYKEALEMYRRVFKGDHTDLAASINNIAGFYNGSGRYAEAEPLYKESLEMRRRLFKGDHPELAISIDNMGYFYNYRGRYAEAETLCKEALEMRRRLFKDDHPSLAISINNMATFYDGRGRYAEAEPLYIEALEMYRRLFNGDHPSLAQCINNMAFFYNGRGRYFEAETLCKEALEMRRRLFKGDHPELAVSINSMAYFYNYRERYSEAEPLFKESLEMFRRLFKGDHPDLAKSISYMAYFYDNRGRYAEAEPLFKESLEVYKNMLNNYFPSLSEREKNMFWNTVSDEFEAYYSFAIKRYLENPDILGNMYDLQLYSKSLLFNSNSKIKKRIMNSKDSVLIDKYKEFTDSKEFLVKLYTMTEDERKKKNFDVDLLEKQTNELEKELSLTSEFYPQPTDKKKLNWRSVITLLGNDEAAVEVVRFRYKEKNRFTDTIYYAFLIVSNRTEEHPDIVILENGNLLENEYYKSYRKMIEFKLPDTYSFECYWGKLYEKLKGFKKIYFAPDGIYNKLNPATLILPNGKYLLDEQDIQQVNSTKDMIFGTMEAKQRSQIYNSAVLIGNPNFSLSDSKVAKLSGIAAGSSENDGFDKINFATRGIDLSNLPGTEKEILDIEQFLKSQKWDVNSYLGDRAIKTAVKTVDNPRILHIATHGMFLEDVEPENKETFGFETKRIIENPLLRSGLFFTGAQNDINNVSGLLTAYEAMNLDLDNTELVVLSACETGLGETKNGEGIFSLRMAFQQAGAKAVVMSLWSVDDESTQELMSNFYKNFVTGMSKRNAFSKAQQIVKDKYKDPYFWGAFVMVGE